MGDFSTPVEGVLRPIGGVAQIPNPMSITSQPHTPESTNLGLTLRSSFRVPVLHSSPELDPASEEVQQVLCLAETLAHNDFPEAAENLALRVLESTPGSAVARNLIGVLRYREGEILQARDQFLEAFDLDPENVHAGLNLLDALADLGRHEEARGIARELRSLPSQGFEAFALGGACRGSRLTFPPSSQN